MNKQDVDDLMSSAIESDSEDVTDTNTDNKENETDRSQNCIVFQ